MIAVLQRSGLPLAPGSYFGRSVGVTGFLPGERSNALPCARNHDHHGNHNDLANRTCRHGRCRCWSGYGPCGCRSCRCGRGRGCWGCVWSAILGTANWPLLDRQQFPSPLLVSSASLTNDPVRRPRSRAADRGPTWRSCRNYCSIPTARPTLAWRDCAFGFSNGVPWSAALV